MNQIKLISLSAVIVLLAILVRDMPYINFIIGNKIWIVYILLSGFILYSVFPVVKIKAVHYLLIPFLFIAFVLTLAGLYLYAEFIGNIIYLILIISVLYKIYLHVKSSS